MSVTTTPDTPVHQAKRLGIQLTEEQLQDIYSGHRSIFTLILAKSGRGKTTSMRNLSPEHTFYLIPKYKPLPFPGGGKYREGDNMLVSTDAGRVKRALRDASKNQNIKYIVIDDAQYIMATEFMEKAMVKGYDKFTIMARNMWDLMLECTELRPGLKVFMLSHEDDNGNERKMKTLGKLLDEKLTPEGLATIVLFGDSVGDTPGERTYFFQTQSDGICNAKSPMGMFPLYIDNDLKAVSDRIDEYYQGVSLEDTQVDLGNIQFDRSERRRGR